MAKQVWGPVRKEEEGPPKKAFQPFCVKNDLEKNFGDMALRDNLSALKDWDGRYGRIRNREQLVATVSCASSCLQ